MTPLTIHQPAPCHESWEAMTPTDRGRHCAACHTEVVDFTHMSDAEVVAFVRQTTPGRRCGRFREDQVDRPLRAGEPPVPGWRRWVGAAVLVLASVVGLKARAQAPGPTERATAETRPPDADGSFLVHGVVRNRWGVPTAGARVRAGSVWDTTDAHGRFRLVLPRSSLKTVRFVVVYHRHPRREECRLFARMPFDSTRRKPYRLTLKKAPVIRNPGFY